MNRLVQDIFCCDKGPKRKTDLIFLFLTVKEIRMNLVSGFRV
jgi:hypothetical protein